MMLLRMNASGIHLSSAKFTWGLTLLVLTFVAYAQQPTGDPFLDAMLRDAAAGNSQHGEQQPDQQPTDNTPATPPSRTPSAPSHAPATDNQLINTAQDPRLIDRKTVNRELGDNTGLSIFNNDDALQGRRISSVDIRYSDTGASVPKQRLLDVIQSAPGTRYSSRNINNDLERLVRKGLVAGNARVVAAPQGENSVSVTFIVEPVSIMGGAGFTGNHRFSERELRRTTKLTTNRTINDRDLVAARSAIIKRYREAGYPDTKVSWRTVPAARHNYRDVIFDIQEGRRIHLVSVSFSGNKQFDSTELRRVMKTKERNFLYLINDSGIINREQLDDDLQSILRLYRNYGYLRAAVTGVDYSQRVKKDRTQLYMRININEGPRYRVRRTSFRGNSVYSAKELEPGLSMYNGDIYSLQKVSDDTTMIRRYYGAKGYADADVRPDISEVGVLRDGTHLIDICYDIDEGRPYAVGTVRIAGNEKTKSHVILRELPLKPGHPFNSVDMETARNRLLNLGYFDSADVSPSLSANPGYRDINITVRERMTGALNLGVAVSSVENVFLYLNATQSNFDIRGLVGGGSFVGGGQRLSVQGKLGVDTQSAGISLVEPWFLDRKISLGNEFYFSNSSYMSDYYTQKDIGYAVSLSHAVTDTQSVRAEYRIENYSYDIEYGAPPFFRMMDGDYTRSNLRISWLYDTRDAVVTPRKGGHLELSAAYSGPGSTVQAYNFGLESSVYYNSYRDSIFSLTLGMQTVEAVDKKKELPLFERCYLGGPTNLRGFRYHDVGMVDEMLAGDETMGGKSSAYLQAEVSVPVIESIRFALFMDAGFVHRDAFDFRMKDFCADYGVGIRFNMAGMAPMAADFAIPFSTHNAIDRDCQFQFYVDYKY